MTYVADERDEKQPHTMQVFPGDGTNFEVTLYDDQFLLYSTGRRTAWTTTASG
jgi:hypothetical protein